MRLYEPFSVRIRQYAEVNVSKMSHFTYFTQNHERNNPRKYFLKIFNLDRVIKT